MKDELNDIIDRVKDFVAEISDLECYNCGHIYDQRDLDACVICGAPVYKKADKFEA